MFWTAAIILLILWVLGLVTSSSFGGLLHILLALAILAIVFQFVSNRRVR